MGYLLMGFRAPWAGAMMVIFLASLTGVPPFAGFVGKFYLFTAAMDKSLFWLVILAGLNSVVGLYYYFKVVKAMFLMSPAEDADTSAIKLHWLQYVVLAVLAIPTLALGLFFGELKELANAAIGLTGLVELILSHKGSQELKDVEKLAADRSPESLIILTDE